MSITYIESMSCVLSFAAAQWSRFGAFLAVKVLVEPFNLTGNKDILCSDSDDDQL